MPEIAVFGSSVGEVGVNTAAMATKMNRSCYNFSIDGTRFLQYNGLIKEHIANNPNLKMVILAETVFGLENNNALTSIDRYLAYSNNNNIYQSLRDVQPDLAFKVRYVPFYKFVVMEHPFYKASAMGWLNKIRKTSHTDLNRGYTPRPDTWQRDMDDINKKASIYNLRVDSMILNRYKETLFELSSRNIKTIIVFMPIHMDGQNLMSNMDNYRKTFTELTNENVQFLDLTVDSMCLDKKNFYNNSHVNTTGSEMVLNRIIEFIK